MGVPTPSKWSKSVPMCIINLQKNLVHGALIDAEILTSLFPHVFAQLGTFWGANALPMDVSTPSESSYVSQKPPKNVGAWDLNRC